MCACGRASASVVGHTGGERAAPCAHICVRGGRALTRRTANMPPRATPTSTYQHQNPRGRRIYLQKNARDVIKMSGITHRFAKGTALLIHDLNVAPQEQHRVVLAYYLAQRAGRRTLQTVDYTNASGLLAGTLTWQQCLFPEKRARIDVVEDDDKR